MSYLTTHVNSFN